MKNFRVLVPRKMSLIDSKALRFFMYSSYWVISVLNIFQAAIILRSIQYLRLTVYALDSDDENDKKKSCLGL